MVPWTRLFHGCLIFSIHVISVPGITDKKVWLRNWQQGLITAYRPSSAELVLSSQTNRDVLYFFVVVKTSSLQLLKGKMLSKYCIDCH